MAEQSTHDVVNQAQSVGDPSPSDVSALNPNYSNALGDSERTTALANTHTTSPSEPDKYRDVDVAEVDPRRNGTGSGAVAPEIGSCNENPLNSVGETDADNSKPTSDTVGEGGGHVVMEDPPVLQTSAEVSGGSDTDTSRADITEYSEKGLKEGKHHGRSSSVKKPISFKAVSVTKSFLAKATAGSVPASKGSSDKAPTTTAKDQPAPRPRLVAKSGSGLRDAMPKAFIATDKLGRGSGPDPNQVWNRNRPVQPAPPKQFTDEELKQEYGIHLATRLQADGEGKQGKWADIDEEEEDWAPDTIEWNDGTKITIAPIETATAPVVSGATDSKADTIKPSVPTTKTPSSVGPNATVLKVGSTTMVSPKAGGLVLKGPSEKPTLVAKPAVAAPIKSPWAPLPPVDRVSPVPTNLAAQHATRFGQKDPHGFEAMPPPPSPTKEIAADDFNRSWRDQAGNTRELFNSQSGRYEPVANARRGSIRAEPAFRPPALLQRPLQSDQQGPAEPSAAFQTNRSTPNQDAGSWNRRRTSSNVSAGSGGYGRRMSSGKGPERPPTSIDSLPESVSHGQVKGQLSGSETTSVDVASTPRDQASVQTSGSEVQDPIEMQKKLMQERRELAIKRRQEQEAKEEADKKERIRARMEALGLPPLEEERGSKAQSTTSQTVVTDKEELTVPDGVPTANGIMPTGQSPPKPPVPEVSGKPKQYGMIKVHHPQTVKNLSFVTEPASNQAWGEVLPADQTPLSTSDAKTEAKNDNLLPIRNGIGDPIRQAPFKLNNDEKHYQPPLEEQKEKSRQALPQGPDTYTSWGEAGLVTHPAATGNLWGTPNGDKALGNGTFDHNLTRLPQGQVNHQPRVSHTRPGPIGPPTVRSTTRPSRNGGTASERASRNSQSVPHSAQRANETNHQVRDLKGKPRQDMRLPKPIAPPALVKKRSPPIPTDINKARVTSGWNNFHVIDAQEGAEETQARMARILSSASVKNQSPPIPKDADQVKVVSSWKNLHVTAPRAESAEAEARTARISPPVPVKNQSPPLPKDAARAEVISSWKNFHVIDAQEGAQETQVRMARILSSASAKNQTPPILNGINKTKVASNWSNFHVIAAREEAEARDKAQKAHDARLAEEARTGVKQESAHEFSDTFVQTAIDETTGRRKKVYNAKEAGTKQEGFSPGRGDHQPGPIPVVDDLPQFKATTDSQVVAPPISEHNYRQATVEKSTGGRQYADIYAPLHLEQEATRQTASNRDDNAMIAPKATSAFANDTAATGRGSKFFPRMLDEDSIPGKPSTTYNSGDFRPASPPPPDSGAHPAYAGKVSRPIVNLPVMKPKPTVRLPPHMREPTVPPHMRKPTVPPHMREPEPTVPPHMREPTVPPHMREPTVPPHMRKPTAPPQMEEPTDPPHMRESTVPPHMRKPTAPPDLSVMQTPVQPLRLVSQPLASTPSWQDRFNGLFGRKASPEKKKHLVAVNSATKVPFEVASPQVRAAVSLPPVHEGDSTTDLLEGGITASTKVEDEEALFEEREFGSLPMVRLPRHAPPAARLPLPRPLCFAPHTEVFKSGILRAIESHSIKPMFWSLWDDENLRDKAFVINVKLPGWMWYRALLMDQRKHSRSASAWRPYVEYRKARKDMKPKETASNSGHTKGVQAPPQSLPKNAMRPAYHGGTWAGRPSGVVQ